MTQMLESHEPSGKIMKRPHRRSFRVAIGAAALACISIAAPHAWSQAARTVKVVVPFSPGGGADILARLLTDQIGPAQRVATVIENRPGAGTAIGTEAVARAAPDGNTLLVVTDSFVVIPHLRRLNYDPLRSFDPVCNLASTPQVIIVNSTSPYRTLADLMAAARTKPGTLTLASPGPAGAAHVLVEMLKRAANIDLTYVPYPGVAPALTALLGQHVTAAFSTYTAVAEHIRTGQMRALAAVSAARIDALPDVPSMAELGFEDLDGDLWYGLFAPAKTPPDTLSQLAGWFTAALRAPELKPKLAAQGLVPVGQCGAEFGAFVRAQYERYGRGIRESNIKAE
jgi:tripartite-type tricarboxylate transporter receptor subunit TctC